VRSTPAEILKLVARVFYASSHRVGRMAGK